MTAGAGGDGGMGGEVIEVQILPQDDNWGDNTTAITGNTSVRSESFQVSRTLQLAVREALSCLLFLFS